MTTIDKYLPSLFEIAVDLAASLRTDERFERLLQATLKVIPCDAAAILKLEHHQLYPIAQVGLKREADGRHFHVGAHPRLEQIIGHRGVTRFDQTSTLPDPYDGLVEVIEGNLPVHACMGAPLIIGGETWGVITFDALQPDAFAAIEDPLVLAFSTLAAAAASSADYIAALEISARREHEVNQNLIDQIIVPGGREMVGDSPAMQTLQREVDLVADSSLAVLITGETGVGKELVARAVHQRSGRRDRPMVYLNCAALPENLVESELFGHKKGAFTGATRDYRGKFELANGGTLFLDEIGELPLGVQAKLLRTVQSGEVQTLGSENLMHVDVRIVAATNRNLKREAMDGNFRQDLFHRLSVYPIRVPPLRERDCDVPLLAGYFIEKLSVQLNLKGVSLSVDAERALKSYSWPGNIRELEHTISRALLHIKNRNEPGPSQVQRTDLGELSPHRETLESRPRNTLPPEKGMSMARMVDQFQAGIIRQRLTQANGNWSKAASDLGLHRSNLHRLARRLGIK